MPGGNGTGPMGMGPMTGRAAGFCAGFERPGFANRMSGRGFGMGFARGGGFGRRNRFYATGMTGWQRSFADVPQMSRDQEVEMLKNQAASLQNALQEVNDQIQKLESEDK